MKQDVPQEVSPHAHQTHACTYARMDAPRTYTHMHAHACMHTQMHAHAHTHTHTYTRTHTHIHTKQGKPFSCHLHGRMHLH